MNLVRAGALLAALGVHGAFLGAFLISSAYEPDVAALQSGAGKDDLTIIATVTMQTEESLGLDAASVQRQAELAGGQAQPKEAAPKEPDKIELPPEEAQPPAPVEEKKPEKEAVEEQRPSNPAPASEAQEEQRASSRTYEARRSQALSLYNSSVYQALMRHALRPKTVEKGRVVIELTLAPSGYFLAHRVVKSSGSDTLDRTAMISLERAAPFPPAPPEAGAQPHTLRVPFEYAVK